MRSTLFLIVSLALTVSVTLSSITVNRNVVVSQQQHNNYHSNRQPVRLTVGQTYVYRYKGRLLTGIPQLSNQYSGLEIESDLILQSNADNSVALKMSNIRVGKHNGPVSGSDYHEDIVFDHQLNKEYSREVSKPIRFQYINGLVNGFTADQSEPEWSLNIKRSVLSLFNINLNPKKILKSYENQNQILKPDSAQHLTVYPVYEDGINGICETVYEVNHIQDVRNSYQSVLDQEFVVNVTKTRNYDNCLTEPSIANDNYDVRGCPSVCRKHKSFSAVPGYYPTPDALNDPYMSGCPCNKEPNASPVDSFNFVNYNISLVSVDPTIESIYSEGKNTFTNNGDEIVVIVQQNVTLVQRGRATQQIQQIPNPRPQQGLSFRISNSEKQMPLDIPYYNIFGTPNVEELVLLVPQLLDSLSSDIVSEDLSSTKDFSQKTVQIINALAVLEIAQLKELYEQVAQPGQSSRATEKEQIERKLFLDSLPLAGTNPSAIFIKNLIAENKVSTFEAKELVEAVPQNLFLIEKETIDEYLDLFQNQNIISRRHLYSSTGIAFAKLIKEAFLKRQQTPGDVPNGGDSGGGGVSVGQSRAQTTVQVSQNPNRVTVQQQYPNSQRVYQNRNDWIEQSFSQSGAITESDVQRYVQIVERLLNESNEFYQKVTLIETLAHMAVPQVLPVLEPYISGSISSDKCPGYPVEQLSDQDEECDFIRQVAIYSLSHLNQFYPKQVQPLVLPVYNDDSEPYEIRIAAFTTLLFSKPEKQVLERIASELHAQNNRQIKSFVFSALNTVSNFSVPCFRKMSQNVQHIVDHVQEAEFGAQYSKMIGYDYYSDEKDFGLYSLFEWVSNNVSRVPRSGYFSFGQSSGPFTDEFIEFGFNSKGMESLLERLINEPNSVLNDMFEGLKGKGRDRRLTKRNTDSPQQLLQVLKERLNLEIRGDDEPKATVFFKLFDRTSYYSLDKQYIHSVIDSSEDSLKDIAQSLLQGENYHYIKLVMPSQLYKVVPSQIGFPVVVTHRHPTILSVRVQNAKLQLETAPKTIYPIGANLTAQIKPQLLYSSLTFVFAVNPADRQAFGVNVEKSTKLLTDIEVSVGYVRPKNLLTASLVPNVNTEVLYHSTQSQTFIAKANIAGAPDRDWLQDSQPIQTMPVPFSHEQTYGQQLLGLGVRVQVNSENVWSEQSLYNSETYDEQGIVAALVESWRNPGLNPREVHVALESDREEPVSGYDFTLRYKWVANDNEGADDNDDSDESSQSDESDSDESDQSSNSKSSESNSSESDSQESDDSSESSGSSEQSDESNAVVRSSLRRRIRQRLNKAVNNKDNKEREKRSVKNNKESNESSDESSNESGDESWSKSGSKESSQSSSSESESSEERQRNNNNNRHNSKSAQSSESDSSSSEASDESSSFEDSVFDYEDVMRLILGQEFKKRSIKRIANEMIKKTESVWEMSWDSDNQNEDNEESQVPATIAHDIAITAVARGPRPTYLAANILYVHTYDYRTIWVKTDGHIKTPKGVYLEVPTLFCADAVLSYPPLPGQFYYDPTALQSQKAKIQAQLGWGQQCHNDGGVIITGVMENTEDQVIRPEDFSVQSGSSAQQVQQWFYQQCQVDRADGQPQSYACERAIIEDSYFNQLILDVQYKNVPDQVLNWTQKLNLALKVSLYDQLDNNELNVNNADNQVRIVAQYSSRIPDIQLANLRIQTPNENSFYEKINIPYVRPVSALLSTSEVYSNLLYGYSPQSRCALMEDFVRTFDNVTYQIPDTQCQYLVAKDCSAAERWAVFAQRLDSEANTKTVTVLTGGSEVKLLPPLQQNLVQVVVDGHTHEVTFKRPVTLAGNKNDLRIYLRKTVSDSVNPIVVLESDLNDLEVLFDGKNARIQVSNRYQGKTCGLCGDNNDETEDEFSGPDQCLYDNSQDFASSYALSGQHCTQQSIPQGPKRCPNQQQQQQQQQEQQSGIVHRKQVKIVETPSGRTAVVRQEVRAQQSQQQRLQTLENAANFEELQRSQQQQLERQQSRQNGQQLSRTQQSALVGATAQQQQILQRMRTQYIQRDDMTCFTTQPVLTCVRGVPTHMQTVKLDFHCLPKNSPFTQDLIAESETGVVIKQLARKRVDLRQAVSVPVSCA
jgi:uncharacterized protein YlbG (UPF0298 family)